MTALPPPPVPAGADLTHYDDMPLEVRRLRDSGIAGVADAEVFRCAVLLWCAAWHQVPAGSLPNEDADLCRLVGLGRDLKTWKRIKPGVMRGWRPFADGRLYHRVVAEKAVEGWNRTRLKDWAMACDRLRKENKAREERRETKLPMPDRPAVIPMEWPDDFQTPSAGNSASLPPENGLNRIEGKGIEAKEVSRAEIPEDTARAPDDDPAPPAFLSRSRPIDPSWQPSESAIAQLRASRPDVTDDVIALRTIEFHAWCAANAKTTFNPDATWLGFMVKTHVQRPHNPRHAASGAPSISDGIAATFARRYLPPRG